MKNLISNIEAYVTNRFVDKTHILKTNLEPGTFYERDTRILHGLFNQLVDYVEIDLAWLYIIFIEETTALPSSSVKSSLLNFKIFERSPEMGVARLCEEISWKDDPTYTEYSKKNSEDAEEILELYTWWKARTENDTRVDKIMMKRLIDISDSLWT